MPNDYSASTVQTVSFFSQCRPFGNVVWYLWLLRCCKWNSSMFRQLSGHQYETLHGLLTLAVSFHTKNLITLLVCYVLQYFEQRNIPLTHPTSRTSADRVSGQETVGNAEFSQPHLSMVNNSNQLLLLLWLLYFQTSILCSVLLIHYRLLITTD